jgi:hypothetical protein
MCDFKNFPGEKPRTPAPHGIEPRLNAAEMETEERPRGEEMDGPLQDKPCMHGLPTIFPGAGSENDPNYLPNQRICESDGCDRTRLRPCSEHFGNASFLRADRSVEIVRHFRTQSYVAFTRQRTTPMSGL